MKLRNPFKLPKLTLLLLVVSLWRVVLVDADSPILFLDGTVSYSQRASLGVDKQVIVINNQFPGPLLNATTNDLLNINIHNNLTEPFLITWNGLQLRKNSWQDGMQETNCPIQPGHDWTYSFQIKDQIGSFFYFPSLLLQKADGGYGAIRVNNRQLVSVPFDQPYKEYDILTGDWYNADHRDMRASLDDGSPLSKPDGILINGLGPEQAIFYFEPGTTYRPRISNVGLKTSLNLRIEEHIFLLVETEGSYTLQQYYSSLDVHVGQSYSVLSEIYIGLTSVKIETHVTQRQLVLCNMNFNFHTCKPNIYFRYVLVTGKNQSNSGTSYCMVASSCFIPFQLIGVGIIRYPGSQPYPITPLPVGPLPFDYSFSLAQARSIRWNLTAGAAGPNPQGSYHYGPINISQTLVIENGIMNNGKFRYTINGKSFVHPDTPLKLLDFFHLSVDSVPVTFPPALATSIIAVNYHDFLHLVLLNPLPHLQTWHLDGYNFFVVDMDWGMWDESKMKQYNMIDAISSSTVQVYPFSWTAILVKLDSEGLWNLRSQNAENWYLGQELYIRVKGVGKMNGSSAISIEDEAPIPANVIKCGRATNL